MDVGRDRNSQCYSGSGFLLKRIRKAYFSWDANCLALIGLPVFSYLLFRSRIAYQKGRVSWKGRHYAANRKLFCNVGM